MSHLYLCLSPFCKLTLTLSKDMTSISAIILNISANPPGLLILDLCPMAGNWPCSLISRIWLKQHWCVVIVHLETVRLIIFITVNRFVLRLLPLSHSPKSILAFLPLRDMRAETFNGRYFFSAGQTFEGGWHNHKQEFDRLI